MNKKIIVLGAGLTGLSVADNLSPGFDVTIIEKEDKVGGLASSFVKSDCKFDYGPHAFLTKDREIYEYLRKITKNGLPSIGKKHVSIFFRKKFYSYPLKPSKLFFNINIVISMLCISSYIFHNCKRIILRNKSRSFEEWVISRFGRQLYLLFFRDYTIKVWGAHPSTRAASFASERIPPLKFSELFLALFSKKKEVDLKKDFDSEILYYPPEGIDKVAEILKDRSVKQGSKILTNASLNKIHMKNSRITHIELEKDKKKQMLRCDYLISTIPIPDLLSLVHPNIDDDVLLAGKKLKYRPVDFLFLLISKDKVFKNKEQWVYFQDKQFIFYRIYETSAFSSLLVKKGMTGLGIELSTQSDYTDKDDILKKVISDLERLGFIKKDEVKMYTFDRIKHGYPIYDIDYKKNLDTINRRISQLDNLISVGRQGMFRYLDMDHCIKLGNLVKEIIKNKKSKSSLYDICAEHGKG
jgi:UDP-galactopyranose mutase